MKITGFLCIKYSLTHFTQFCNSIMKLAAVGQMTQHDAGALVAAVEEQQAAVDDELLELAVRQTEAFFADMAERAAVGHEYAGILRQIQGMRGARHHPHRKKAGKQNDEAILREQPSRGEGGQRHEDAAGHRRDGVEQRDVLDLFARFKLIGERIHHFFVP